MCVNNSTDNRNTKWLRKTNEWRKCNNATHTSDAQKRVSSARLAQSAASQPPLALVATLSSHRRTESPPRRRHPSGRPEGRTSAGSGVTAHESTTTTAREVGWWRGKTAFPTSTDARKTTSKIRRTSNRRRRRKETTSSWIAAVVLVGRQEAAASSHHRRRHAARRTREASPPKLRRWHWLWRT